MHRLLFFVTILLYSCSSDSDITIDPTSNVSHALTKDTLVMDRPDISEGKLVYYNIFRRSYQGHWNLSEAEFQEMQDSNPYGMHTAHESIFSSYLIFAGLVINETDEMAEHNNQLIVERIEELEGFSFEVKDGDKTQQGEIKYNKATDAYQVLFNDSVVLNHPCEVISEYTFSLDQIIPGGYPELLIIESYYIVNGDNYIMSIYQFK